MNKLITFLVFVALVMYLTDEKANAHPSLVPRDNDSEGGADPGSTARCCCCGYCISCDDPTSTFIRSIQLIDASSSSIDMIPESQTQRKSQKASCCCCGWCLYC